MAIERLSPGRQGWDEFYSNHIMRYHFAADILRQKTVMKILDAACGSGFGSDYLAKKIVDASVIAIDISKDAIEIAKSNFPANNIEYISDDCHTLSACAVHAPFDAIVSFETLEHLTDGPCFVKSCYERLANGGLLVISTPNQKVTSPDNIIKWEYHEKEYNANELLNMLREAGFVNIKLFGQQFNFRGKFKNEVRAELNKLWSNPFIRVGRFLQTILRGRAFEPVLKETLDDLEIVPVDSADSSDAMGVDGPFVLIAVAEKK